MKLLIMNDGNPNPEGSLFLNRFKINLNDIFRNSAIVTGNRILTNIVYFSIHKSTLMYVSSECFVT